MPRISIITTYDNKGMNRAQKDFARATKQFSGIGQTAKKAALGAATIGIAALGAGVKFAMMAEESAVADNRITQINKSMGLFGAQSGKVTDRLIKQASAQAALTGVDDDVIKGTQAKLLTFKDLAKTADKAGGAFDRAQKAAIDMAAAGFGEAEGNAVQLGKALQDPIKGITALAKSGVTFTAKEKEKIKALTESGKLLDAQNMILKAVETQVGGTAQATAKSSDIMKWALGEAGESIGGLLLPAFEKATSFVTKKIVPAIQAFVDKIKSGQDPISAISDTLRDAFGPKIATAFNYAVGAIQGFWDVIKGVAGWVVANRAWIEPMVVGITAMVAVYKVYNTIMGIARVVQAASTVAQLALNAAWAANPIGVIVLLIVGLVAAFMYLWKTNDGFRKAVIAGWNAIKAGAIAIWGAIKTGISLAWNGIKKLFAWSPVGLVVGNWDKIRSGAASAWGAIKSTVSNLWNGLVNTIKAGASFFKNIGRDIVDGLKAGISGAWRSLVSKFSGLTAMLPAAVKKILGISSPSKVFAGIGGNIGQGLAQGILGTQGLVRAATSGLVDTAYGSGSSGFSASSGSRSVEVRLTINAPGADASTVSGLKSAGSDILGALTRELKLT